MGATHHIDFVDLYDYCGYFLMGCTHPTNSLGPVLQCRQGDLLVVIIGELDIPV
jgi:hypothetical protein